MRGEERRGSPAATATFRRRLADLKRNGCNVLLVGDDALGAACERLLGESSAGPRYRLFVTADERPATARARLATVQSGPYRDSAAVLNWRFDDRESDGADDTDAGGIDAVDSATRAGDAPTVREETVETDDLRELGSAFEAFVEAFEADHGGLSPAELRVCFDSLTPLVAEYDARDVRRHLLGLTEAVERVNGMAHYHLPAEYDSETVASIEPLFDAVVEVQRAEGSDEQRWHLPDSDITTEWVPL